MIAIKKQVRAKEKGARWDPDSKGFEDGEGRKGADSMCVSFRCVAGFYVNNVHQNMAGARIVDAPFIKWGHSPYQQSDLT